jgi:mRNA interferase RelE/StbE
MAKRQKRKPVAYQVFLEPRAHAQRRKLPGNMRQRVKQAIGALAHNPRPHHSQELDLSGPRGQVTLSEGIELRRLRLEHWRVLYAVDENWQAVTVLTIRRRPPYDYEDLDELVIELEA